MNRVDLLQQITRYGFKYRQLPDTSILIEDSGHGPMTEGEAMKWCQRRERTHCHNCGKKFDNAHGA